MKTSYQQFLMWFFFAHAFFLETGAAIFWDQRLGLAGLVSIIAAGIMAFSLGISRTRPPRCY